MKQEFMVITAVAVLMVLIGANSKPAYAGDDSREELERALVALGQRTGDPLVVRVASAIARQCAANAISGSADFTEQCRRFRIALFSGSQDQNIIRAVRAWLPDEALALGRGFSKLASLKVGAIQARITQLRSNRDTTSQQSNNGVELNVAGDLAQLLGYGASDSTPGLDGRWGFFSSVSYYKGDREVQLTEPGFWYHGGKVGVGIDYKFNNNWVSGATFGRSRLSQHLLGQGQNDTYTSNYGLYSSWNGERLYADVFFVKSISDQALDRRVEYGFDATATEDRLDVSATHTSYTQSDADQWGVGIGYDVLRGKWNLGVVAGIKWANTDTDPYTEIASSGSTPLLVRVEEQHIESQIFTIGGSLNRAYSQSWGVITTELDINMMHEAKDDQRQIRSFLIFGDSSLPLDLETLAPDRDWGEVGVTVTTVLPHSLQFFFNYRKLFGIDGFSRDVTYLGGRVDF